VRKRPASLSECFFLKANTNLHEKEVIIDAGSFSDSKVMTKGALDELHIDAASKCTVARFKSLENQTGYACFFGSNGFIVGNTDATRTKVIARSVKIVSVEEKDSSPDTLNHLVIKYQMLEVDLDERNGIAVQLNGLSKGDFYGLADVAVSVVDSSVADQVTVSVTEICSGANVVGLTDVSFSIIETSTGDSISVTGVTTDINDNYVVSATMAAGDHTIGLTSPTTQPAGVLVEQSGANATFTAVA